MALIIKPTQDNKIYIQGTDIELGEVYVRIEFSCRSNGSTMEMAFISHLNSTKYQDGETIKTTLPLNNFTDDIDTETKTQTVEEAHNLSKEHFEGLGYVCIIDL